MIELEIESKRIPGKGNWETLYVIPFMPLVRMNHRQHILHLSKIIVLCYSTNESIIKFTNWLHD